MSRAPYLPVVHSVWHGDMGICEIHQTLKHKERVKFEWIPTKYPPFGEDSDSKLLSLIAFSLKVFLHPDPEVEYQNTQQKELN